MLNIHDLLNVVSEYNIGEGTSVFDKFMSDIDSAHQITPTSNGLQLLVDIVYSLYYPHIGVLMSDMFPLWESSELADSPFPCTDGHNGFEEFFLHVLTYQFAKHNVYFPASTDQPGTIGPLCRPNLTVLWCALYAHRNIVFYDYNFIGSAFDALQSKRMTAFEADTYITEFLRYCKTHLSGQSTTRIERKECCNVQVQQPCA